MKKIKIHGKLALNKQTLVQLTDLGSVQGGNVAPPCTCSCGACNSSPQNPQTCQGATCVFLDGCA